MYARKLTKEELIKNGITEVTPDGHVFMNEWEILPKLNNSGYFIFTLDEVNENGERIKIPNEKSAFGYVYKTHSVGLHRLMWAWFYGEVPGGMVIHHKDHDRRHNHLDNFKCESQVSNLNEDRTPSDQEVPCKLDRPRSHYEEKLNDYLAAYELAKKTRDAKAVHKLRCNIYRLRANLRYYDAHKGEEVIKCTSVEEATTQREYKALRAAQIRRFKEELKILHDRYTKSRKERGPNHPLTVVAREKWKRGIEVSNKWIAEHPAQRTGEMRL